MKKMMFLAALCLVLTGCGGEQTMETLADELAEPVMAQPREVGVRLPDNAVAPVLESDTEQVYFCEDYEIIIQTLSSGDLEETVQTLSGYEKEELTVLETLQDGVKRYDFVWACAGEEGDLLGRAVILDDGSYHYCMSALRPAEDTENTQIVWKDVFSSFTLV